MEKVQWWQNTVVYQIYPRSFQDSNGDGVGDIPGIIERLPYLKALGVQVIWLSPIYQSPNDDNGYDISDYRKVLPEFGTMADVQEMLEVAHHLGLKIMMDLVVTILLMNINGLKRVVKTRIILIAIITFGVILWMVTNLIIGCQTLVDQHGNLTIIHNSIICIYSQRSNQILIGITPIYDKIFTTQ